MPEIHQLVGVKASPAKVFAAVATAKGVSGWWSKTVKGEVAQGKTFDVVFDTAKIRLKVTVLKKEKKVVWKPVKDDYGMERTTISFEITKKGNETILKMAHTGFKGKPDFFFSFMSMKWATFMLSLKDYIEKGKGRPFPRDVYIMHQDI